MVASQLKHNKPQSIGSWLRNSHRQRRWGGIELQTQLTDHNDFRVTSHEQISGPSRHQQTGEQAADRWLNFHVLVQCHSPHNYTLIIIIDHRCYISLKYTTYWSNHRLPNCIEHSTKVGPTHKHTHTHTHSRSTKLNGM